MDINKQQNLGLDEDPPVLTLALGLTFTFGLAARLPLATLKRRSGMVLRSLKAR